MVLFSNRRSRHNFYHTAVVAGRTFSVAYLGLLKISKYNTLCRFSKIVFAIRFETGVVLMKN